MLGDVCTRLTCPWIVQYYDLLDANLTANPIAQLISASSKFIKEHLPVLEHIEAQGGARGVGPHAANFWSSGRNEEGNSIILTCSEEIILCSFFENRQI